jgi:hypothetical protein
MHHVVRMVGLLQKIKQAQRFRNGLKGNMCVLLFLHYSSFIHTRHASSHPPRH